MGTPKVKLLTLINVLQTLVNNVKSLLYYDVRHTFGNMPKSSRRKLITNTNGKLRTT